jgi:hypothetical protein
MRGTMGGMPRFTPKGTHHEPKRTRYAPWLLAGVIVLGISVWVIGQFRTAARVADFSAHAALTKEISDQLAAIPPGGQYPSSLKELPLTYPDGGDTTLLERFEYYSTGSQFTLKTVLGWSKENQREIIHTYPGTPADLPDTF